ncbi:PQ loop repeat-domain-containing protein [Mycena sp. CBHHK59/15]|nr:PQ loop repeat-domain-containing protein [Mycena sp. CBHHK59/15]
MPVNRVAENVLGTLGTVCWTAQLAPQVWKSYREKSTKGLSEWLVLCWGVSGGFFGVYAIIQNLNIPLIIQPQLFGLLCLISWGQCQYYDSTRLKYLSFIIASGFIAIIIGFEAGMVFAVRPSFEEGNNRAIQFFGIFSSVLLVFGLVTQYYEIYQRREVVGLSIMFMIVDFLRGVFSDLSLAFKPKFDAIAAITYSLVVVMDGVVYLP